ncbi:uncharacterized protein LOC124146943 [Haliotis rufescens]|uniref:uncharacterized protein LOC124146943 n=1 Tax=Haliotis rufescens TaxID=6454 RepID=UPI00201F1CA2|nr:uncharacterized protein LOC124146943 [Haliotis rufescens]
MAITTGEPRLLIAIANDITLYRSNGSMLWTETLSQSSRAMAYYYRKNRIYLGTNPVTSIQLDGGDNQTHGTNYSGTILGMSIDECRDLIYLSVSGDRVVKMTSDGTWTIMAPDLEVSKPRQNQLNLEDNVLYWADEGFKTMKSVKTNEASPVTTMFTSTSTVWGMDVDIPAQRIYWCAKSTGDVWVFDMSTSTNTQLVPNGGPVSGSCSGLRLYNDYIYLIYYRHGYVEKRSKDGLLVEKLLDGVIPGAKTKYMAIIE